ncbi:MAG: hypothetical protein JSS39_14525 [Nitrospira sp.]|nr:hypothetical protein [Nitrospira sp.]
MKWFKHPSAFRNSKGVAFIIDHGGLQAYGAFCMTCEIVAEQMGPIDIECRQTLSTRRWTLLLGVPRAKFHKIIKIFSESQLCSVIHLNDDDENVTIAIPILAKLRDEYSRKSGHSPDKIRTLSPPSEKTTTQQKKSEASRKQLMDENRDSGEAFRSEDGFSRVDEISASDSEVVQMLKRNGQRA